MYICMMKTYYFLFILSLACASCSDGAGKQAQKTKDSVENAELKQVDRMLENQDSILKAKEKELMEQYGN